MNRRNFLEILASIPIFSTFVNGAATGKPPLRRVRPSDALWPTPSKWQSLNKAVGGRLIEVKSPISNCKTSAAECEQVFKDLKNPYYIGDHPGLTQTSGWVDAWESKPSVYAIAAENTQDVIEGINFARENNLRLVVKGGGHSYQGTSNAPDSLLIWTRKMNKITIHDKFVPAGALYKQRPQHAVTVEAGAIWMHTYNEVTTKAGRYVQGGGCATVGVAGLIQSGGFGSFSKNFGLAAAALIEAEVVTADGKARIVNAYNDPDLFWGLKGGGGGSLGVVTKLTLKTRELPEYFGAVFGTIKAKSDEAFKRLIAKIVIFYQENLFNPNWGEQIRFSQDNTIEVQMLCQGLTKTQAETVWQPLLDWVKDSQNDFVIAEPMMIAAFPARHFWDPEFLQKNVPNFIGADDRKDAPAGNIFWIGDGDESGQVLHSYRSAWLPASLLKKENQLSLTNALFAGTRHSSFSLHFNKGLAGAPLKEIAAARDTATNPSVLTAFALLIAADDGPPAFEGIAGHEPDVATARSDSAKIDMAMDAISKIAPGAGSYLSESNFFEEDWKHSFWGSNYASLAAVKKKYDRNGLFFVHHGVGSDEWSSDGFVRITRKS